MLKRNTPTKQLIRDSLEAADTALSQDMLEKQLAGQVDRVTIYRVLNSFCEDGIVHRVISDEGKAFYALCKKCKAEQHNHEHAHFRCLTCQRVECLPAAVSVSLPKGYRLESMNYWLSGYCKSCG